MSFIEVYSIRDCFEDIELLFSKANINLRDVLSQMPISADTANTELANAQHRIENYLINQDEKIKKLQNEITNLKYKY